MECIPNGYVLLPRQSPVSSAPPHIRDIWNYLMCSARFKDSGLLKRGQLHVTYEQIQKDLSWSVGYRRESYSRHQCETAIKFFKREKMITSSKSFPGMVITILTYDFYQNAGNYENDYESKQNDGPKIPNHESHNESHNENHNESHNENGYESHNPPEEKESDTEELSGEDSTREPQVTGQRKPQRKPQREPQRKPHLINKKNVKKDKKDKKEKNDNKIHTLALFKKSKNNQKESKPNRYPEDFEAFWKKYPNKKSKKQALKTWEKLKMCGELPELDLILSAIGQQEEERRRNAETNAWSPQWKHPSTWLNSGCWTDEVCLTTNIPVNRSPRGRFMTLEDRNKQAAWEFLNDE